MSMDIDADMNITDPGDPTPELRATFELPRGVTSAKYVNQMREVVAYDIMSDMFMVRYDWLDSDGNKRLWFPDKFRCNDMSNLERDCLQEQRAIAVRVRSQENQTNGR